jgi:uncharacterized protein with PIN domain
MTHTLEPRNGFDWSRVSWGGPHDPVSDDCSYCGQSLDQDERDYVALRLWSDDGHAAAFCDACMAKYWGMSQ